MSPRPALPLRLEYLLLGLIRRQPSHGYELLRAWNEPDSLGLIWQVKPGPLYAALDKLETLGYLEAEALAGGCAPHRKPYHITPAGEAAFLEWMQTPVCAARDFRQVFLAKLYFSTDVDEDVVAKLLARQQNLCRAWLASFQQRVATASEFERQVLSFRIRQVQCILEWLSEQVPASQPQSLGGLL